MRRIPISLLSISFTFSQQKSVDTPQNIANAHTIYSNGKEMRKNAKNDFELAESYLTMGDGKYKDGDYRSAITYLEKADKYSESANDIDLRIGIISLLVDTYRLAGLPTESDAKLKEVENIADKNNTSQEAQVLQAQARVLEIDKKFCEAIPIRKRELYLYETNVNPNIQQKKEMLTFANIHSAYLNLKCGNKFEALKNLHHVENIYKDLGDKKPTYFLENYYLVKALIALSEKDSLTAKQWFTKSYKTAKLTLNKTTMKRILNEMRDSKTFNTLAEKNEISEALLSIQNFQVEVTKDVTEIEVEKKNIKIKNEKYNQIIYASIFIFLIIGLILVIFYYRQKNRKIYTNYKQILRSIEAKKEQKIVSPNEDLSIETDFNISNHISSQQENLILKQLVRLEEKLFFTSKNMSATQLAAMLKITPRNLSNILKKYRNDDFYNYLNTLRIDYINETLKEHPEFLNYKIAALADMCGYNSHSHFTLIFKSKTGISPSQYIEFLQKEKIS